MTRKSKLLSTAIPLCTCAVTACTLPDVGSSNRPSLDAAVSVELVEKLRIGSVDDPDYGFSRPAGVTVDRDGELYVFEGSDRRIRVYSGTGDLLRTIGGTGEGPGEFDALGVVYFGVRGDTIWAFDARRGRISIFDRLGQVLTSSQVEPVRVSLYEETAAVWPLAMDADGLLVGELGSTARAEAAAGPAPDSINVPRIRFSTRGSVIDTVGTYPWRISADAEIISIGSSQYIIPAISGSNPITTLLPDGRVEVRQSHDEPDVVQVARLDHWGDTIRAAAFRFTAIPFPEEHLNRLATQTSQRVGRTMLPNGVRLSASPADSAAARVAIRDALSVVPVQPPVANVVAGDDGSLWLQRGEEQDGGRRWTILDPQYRIRGEVTFPNLGRIAWAGPDVVWVVERDDLEVPWLVKYELVGPG